MKNLFKVLPCLVIAAVVAVAQQGGESKPQPSALQPTSDVLVKALLAADGAQNKKETPSAEELKKTIDQEIAKSAVSSLVSSSQNPARKIPKPGDKFSSITSDNLMIMIDGAVYYRLGGTIYPVPGGGASGCFAPDTEVKIQKARMKFEAQSKAAEEKVGQEEKD